MPRIAGINPWISIWSRPRQTIRALLKTRPKYGVLFLPAVFVLQSFLFHAGLWSLGLKSPSARLLALGVGLAPVAGVVWLNIAGFLFYLTGRWFGGQAPMHCLRTVLAWSKIPSIVGVTICFFLLLINSEIAWVPRNIGHSELFAYLILLLLSLWSLVILVQGIREVQGFSIGKAFFNVLTAWICSSTLFVLSFLLLRHLITVYY